MSKIRIILCLCLTLALGGCKMTEIYQAEKFIDPDKLYDTFWNTISYTSDNETSLGGIGGARYMFYASKSLDELILLQFGFDLNDLNDPLKCSFVCTCNLSFDKRNNTLTVKTISEEFSYKVTRLDDRYLVLVDPENDMIVQSYFNCHNQELERVTQTVNSIPSRWVDFFNQLAKSQPND